MTIPQEAVEAAATIVQNETHGAEWARGIARLAVEAAAPYMLVHVHHHDIEKRAEHFNEGYEAAVTQGLADDPTLADDWLQEKLREAQEAAWDEGHKTKARFPYGKRGLGTDDNPYRKDAQ